MLEQEVDDKGTDQDEAQNMLKTLRDQGFDGSDEKFAVALGRTLEQVQAMIGGTETMTLSNFTLEGLDKRAVAARVAFDFRVGGTLSVAANQADGTYVGTFDVSIQYP